MVAPIGVLYDLVINRHASRKDSEHKELCKTPQSAEFFFLIYEASIRRTRTLQSLLFKGRLFCMYTEITRSILRPKKGKNCS